MRKSFTYIISIILIIVMLFTANVFAVDTESEAAAAAGSEAVTTTEAEPTTSPLSLSLLTKMVFTFSDPSSAIEDLFSIIKPVIKEAVADTTTSAEQPEFEISGEVDPAKPMVALTFDDGPYSPVTDRIVNKLAEYGGRATFFVVGQRVPSFYGSVVNAAANGNEIANHTWNHTTLTKISGAQVHKQMNDTDYIVSVYTGKGTTIMRPVGGSHNATVDASVGKPVILWSLDTLDWKNRNASSVTNAVLNNVKDGDIILMHDLYKSTADACDVIIPELVARGYQLVTVSELAEARGITLQNGATYSSIRPN